jgi:tRNA(fMet)-specific endonuclease VapC
MKSLLVDTNVFSMVFKQDSAAPGYVECMRGKRLHVSFMTVAELRQWALIRDWGKRRIESLEQALRNYVTLGFDDPTAWRWAEVGLHQRRAGRNRQDRGDWWIAACALRHSMPLLTHNPRDFVGIPGLEVITYASDTLP